MPCWIRRETYRVPTGQRAKIVAVPALASEGPEWSRPHPAVHRHRGSAPSPSRRRSGRPLAPPAVGLIQHPSFPVSRRVRPRHRRRSQSPRRPGWRCSPRGRDVGQGRELWLVQVQGDQIRPLARFDASNFIVDPEGGTIRLEETVDGTRMSHAVGMDFPNNRRERALTWSFTTVLGGKRSSTITLPGSSSISNSDSNPDLLHQRRNRH